MEAERGKGEEVPDWVAGGNTSVQTFVGCLAIKGYKAKEVVLHPS